MNNEMSIFPGTAVGRRFVNFSLMTRTGSSFEYFRNVTHGPTLLFLNPQKTPPVRDIKASPVLGDRGLNILTVNNPESLAESANVIDLVDQTMALTSHLGLPADKEYVCLLDGNQRLVDAVLSPDDLLAWLEARVPALTFREVGQTGESAPVLLLPRVLTPEFCNELMEVWQADNEEGRVSAAVDGKAISALNNDMKRRRDHIIDKTGPFYPRITRIIGEIIAPELYKVFQFEKARTEAYYIGCYNADRKDFFGAHRDNNSPATLGRKFAISFELNDDYQGGGLVFPEYSARRYRAPAGGAVVFSCSLMHEVLPVEAGNRFVLLAFLAESAPRG